LGPSGNEQGGCQFLHLSTGAKITAFKWTVLPMPDNVIVRVNHLGKDQPKDLTFTTDMVDPYQPLMTMSSPQEWQWTQMKIKTRMTS
jgi:hypothetical protein